MMQSSRRSSKNKGLQAMNRSILNVEDGRTYTKQEAMQLFLVLREVLNIILADIVGSDCQEYSSNDIFELLSSKRSR